MKTALGTDPVVFCPGGHDVHGNAAKLDLSGLEAALPELGVALCGAMQKFGFASLGINGAAWKVFAFAVGAAVGGAAGCFYASFVGTLVPDAFFVT